MKHSTSRLLVCGTAGMVMLAACCAHKAPIAASAPPAKAPVQVAETPPAPPARDLNTRTPPAQRPPDAPKTNAGITAPERAKINESLARMEDALFDYDQATIRPDAMTALQSDV